MILPYGKWRTKTKLYIFKELNGGNFMTNELAKNIITEYVFADYDISSIYKFLNTEASLDESEKQLYSEALLTSAMQKAVIALSKPV